MTLCFDESDKNEQHTHKKQQKKKCFHFQCNKQKKKNLVVFKKKQRMKLLQIVIVILLLLWIVPVGWRMTKCNSPTCRVATPGMRTASDCHKLAAQTCQTAEPQLQDCWLNAYSGCIENGGAMNECSTVASSECRASNNATTGCYDSFVKTCLQARGLI